MSRKVSAIVTENVFSGLISGQMYIFNALIQSASLLPASRRLISLCTVTRSVLDALKAWRTKCAAADSMGGFTREGNQQVPRKVLPTSLPLWAVETVLLQHIGARCQGCFWLGWLMLQDQLPQGLRDRPEGSEDQYFTTPHLILQHHLESLVQARNGPEQQRSSSAGSPQDPAPCGIRGRNLLPVLSVFTFSDQKLN